MAYLDGKTLWWLHKKKKIRFVVPAKDKMDIKEDARAIARLGGDEVCFKKRVKTVIRGTGKNGILFKFRGRLICLKNKLLILQYLFFLKFKFFSFTTEFE